MRPSAAASMFQLLVDLGVPSKYPVPGFVWIVLACAVIIAGFLIRQIVITLHHPRQNGTTDKFQALRRGDTASHGAVAERTTNLSAVPLA